MDYKGVSPSEFADRIGVQRSNVTHVLHGRNKPGFQFISKMLETYPDINAKWLLTGNGEMLESGAGTKVPKEQPSELFPPVASFVNDPRKETAPEKTTGEAQDEMPVPPVPEIPGGVNVIKNREIESIVIFYSDQTFKEYRPSK